MRSLTRREFLAKNGTGLGLVGLASLLAERHALVAAPSANPLAAKPGHFPAKVKHIIHVYLNGGPSHLDTFDPKPALHKYKTIPTGNLTTERATGSALPSPFKFQKYGQSGIEISELFAKTATHIDDICFIRSMYAKTPSHEQSMRLMNCGDERLSRPSMGAWLTYGLGSANENLPGFVVLCPGLPVADVSNWRSAFLPGVYQGTHIDTRKKAVADLVEHIANPKICGEDQRQQVDLLTKLNRKHQEARSEDQALEARIQSFELAFRMQTEAADVFDVTKEPKTVRDQYGDTVHGRQLLIARRLIERGVRIVQCYHGDVQPWDSHENIEKNHRHLAGEIDGPLAALLADLKRLGLFHDTLVICGGEFGRTPAVELTAGRPAMGRDHNHWGFTVWLAGGGIKGGTTYGTTDEFGYKAVENPVSVHDLHATILHLLGLDHERLTYRHSGRDYRLTDVYGRVIQDVLA